jgi:putative transposase
VPWKQRKALDERRDFIEEWKCAETSLAELRRRHEVGRQNGYQWLERCEREGEAGLEEHRRALLLQHPQAIPPEVRAVLLNLRARHPSWGPRKLRA